MPILQHLVHDANTIKILDHTQYNILLFDLIEILKERPDTTQVPQSMKIVYFFN